MRLIATVTSAFALLVMGGEAASAKGPAGRFQTPARNIHCIYQRAMQWLPGVSLPAEVRCDTDFETRFTRPPRWCELDFGQAFSVSRNGHGQAICVGDTTRVPSAARLRVGVDHHVGAFHCRAPKRDAIRCTSPRHHGFSLSPKRQSVF